MAGDISGGLGPVLGVRNHHQGWGMCQDTLLDAVEGRGIQGGETFIQYEHGGALQ